MNITFDEILSKTIERDSLNFEEAKFAMNEVMQGKVSSVKLAAWLTALRVKGETPDEIAGFASSLRENSIRIQCSDPNCIDTCGTGGDKAGTFNISTAAAFVAAGAGTTVAKHGNRAASSKSGSADILAELGVKLDVSKDKIEKSLNENGIAFLFAQSLHPAMKNAAPVRKELGFRTVFNFIGPLSNPAGIRRSIVGVPSDEFCMTIARALLKLGFERAFIVHSKDGLDEISISAPTHICEVVNKTILEYEFDPINYGIQRAPLSAIKGGTPAENAEIMKLLLGGKLAGPLEDIVVINAAAGIIVYGKANSWQEAISLARQSIRNGLALLKLKKLIEIYEK
ncbi:MAG: anthranilate phosphoribosyltransferase [Candidatus Nanoarchaeia archaeon]